MHELFLASRIFKIMFYSERLCLHHFFGVFGSKLIGLSVFGENLCASQSRIRIHEFTEGYEWYWMICCVVFSFCLSSCYSKPLYLAGLKTHPIDLGVFTPFLRIDWKTLKITNIHFWDLSPPGDFWVRLKDCLVRFDQKADSVSFMTLMRQNQHLGCNNSLYNYFLFMAEVIVFALPQVNDSILGIFSGI